MLQAKIFEASGTTIGGQTMTIAHLSEAVTAFNASAATGLVAFDDYPHMQTVNLDRIAATATLHMRGESVIASIKILDTPMGKIASQLFESGIPLHIMPVTSADPSSGELKLRIRYLVIPSMPGSIAGYIDTPLKQVQRWVTGSEYWPMFELKEHKY